MTRACFGATRLLLKAVETTDAEFDLELADASKRFAKVHIAGVVI